MTEKSHAADPPILEVRDLQKLFPVGTMFARRNLRALHHVSFTLRRGKVLALVGESGSGKSTAARCVARLIEPSAGQILFKGKNMLAEERRGASLQYRGDVQMIFQDPFGSLNPVKSIAHHLARPLRIHKKSSGTKETAERVDQLLESVGLAPARQFSDKYPYELSGGQRQRVSFARALAVEPEVVLADEPISMLDVSIRMGILNLMERLKDEHGIAYLYITHDLASARYFADETIVMYAGQIVEGAASEELIQHPAHPYTQRLLDAVPDPKAEHGSKQVSGGWQPPILVDPPPGCPFADRCPHVMPVCRQIMPDRTTLNSVHWVRCHLHGSGESSPELSEPNLPLSA
ncbi:MAG: ABC transporter ATP-binding protein [Thermomicrobiales bacterium]|nr:ABC transporter ATP-binding protein [Thermomicrobiales bacterium]